MSLPPDSVSLPMLVPYLIDELRNANPALFADVSDRTLKRLARGSQRIELKAHQDLFRAGEPISDAYFLISGSIKRSALLPGGTESVVELVKAPQFFPLGEIFSTNCHHASTMALVPSVVIRFPVSSFFKYVSDHHEFVLRLFEVTGRRQCELEFEMVQQHTATGTQKVLGYLIKLAGHRMGMAGETTVRLESSKKLVASRLGMTPESFSRALHQLIESGAVVVDGRTVHIQNAALGVKGTEGGPAPMSFSRKPKSVKGDSAPTVAHPVVINLCGRQRFLSQRLAVAWIMIGLKLMPGKAKVQLRQLTIQSEKNLMRLDRVVADDSTRSKLARLKKIWPIYRDLLLKNIPASQYGPEVFKLSELILQAADKLTAEAEDCAGTLEGHLINVAGRNRMLSARMTKLFLLQNWGIGSKELKSFMDQSIHEFQANINELTVRGPQLPECSEQLSNVAENWQNFTASIAMLPIENCVLKHTKSVLIASEALLRQTDATVKMYERLAERVTGVRIKSSMPSSPSKSAH